MALYSKKYLGVPTELTFHPKTHSDDLVLNKQTVKIDPYSSKTDFFPGEDVHLKITGDKAVDLRTVILNFTVQLASSTKQVPATVTVPANNASADPNFRSNFFNTDGKEMHATLNSLPISHLHSWIGSVIKSFNIRLNDTVQIENFDHYNRLRHLLARLTVNQDYRNSQYGNMEGWHWDSNHRLSNQFLNDNTPVLGGGVTAKWRTHLGTEGSVVIDNSAIPASAYDPTGGNIGNAQYNAAQTVDNAKSNTYLDFPTIKNMSYYDRYRKGVIERQYSIRFDLTGLFGRFPKILYLPTVGSLDCYMRFEDAKKVVNFNQDDLLYKVSNMHLQCEFFDLSQAYLNSLKTVLDSQGMTLELDTYLTYELSLDKSSQQTIRLWRRLTSLKTVYFGIYRTNSDGKKEALKADQQMRYDHCGLKHYQLYIDGRPIQAHPISTETTYKSTVGNPDLNDKDNYPTTVINSEAEWELMKSLRYHGDVRSSPFYDIKHRDGSGNNRLITTNYANQTQTVFNAQRDTRALPFAVYGVDLEKSDLLSGTSLSNELALQLKFESSLPESIPTQDVAGAGGGAAENFNYKLFMFLHYDKRVILHSGLRVTEME